MWIQIQSERWVNKWVGRWMDGWVFGGWVVAGWLGHWVDGWMVRWIGDEWMDGWERGGKRQGLSAYSSQEHRQKSQDARLPTPQFTFQFISF